jgi:hypothetical protein
MPARPQSWRRTVQPQVPRHTRPPRPTVSARHYSPRLAVHPHTHRHVLLKRARKHQVSILQIVPAETSGNSLNQNSLAATAGPAVHKKHSLHNLCEVLGTQHCLLPGECECEVAGECNTIAVDLS